MEVNGILGPCKRNNIVGGQIYGNARCHLKGFCTLDCWGGPNEVESSTTIFGQKATRGSSLAYPDGEIHEIDALRPHGLIGCSCDESGGRSELLGKCGPTRYRRGLPASILHMGPIQKCYGAAV